MNQILSTANAEKLINQYCKIIFTLGKMQGVYENTKSELSTVNDFEDTVKELLAFIQSEYTLKG